jgi:hypothetical protein
MILPLVLVMTVITHPDVPPVQIGRFESERECSLAANALAQDSATLTELTSVLGVRGRAHAQLSCRVDT